MTRELEIACDTAAKSDDFCSALRLVDLYTLADRDDIDWEAEADLARSLLEQEAGPDSTPDLPPDSSRAA